jgi:hypothetical protein
MIGCRRGDDERDELERIRPGRPFFNYCEVAYLQEQGGSTTLGAV